MDFQKINISKRQKKRARQLKNKMQKINTIKNKKKLHLELNEYFYKKNIGWWWLLGY